MNKNRVTVHIICSIQNGIEILDIQFVIFNLLLYQLILSIAPRICDYIKRY